MIRSFKHKGLKKFYLNGSTAGIQSEHEFKIQIILSALDNAINVQDMNLPGFRLHKLSGQRNDIWSVWVSGNWRITFRFIDGFAEIVNYEDYH
ncbi:type II toxin-antitoxin system RelE/ParE family toxin [Marinicella sp. S1101]|uniref:type II toxin-antitoxin system RelE/ParE family toxin n=1 Tax=Marinicella marina TaxID=2996016 RepID=UPI002260E713|nr:type II toxin-antitoxin system RelE/ParE family toxin [Marinicella marina]MCX7554399.1 type II toxin-antitoxin system RelE/ParE family toxin [Marinicella marina]MDJ1138610.1 type II toxin-antitoxin system RelE/ParE family toxin [Marinicella marina]